MGTAAPQPTLNRLRQELAGIDPSLAPRLADEEHMIGLTGPVDALLGGGLARGALHEITPAAPFHFAAAGGFALALAARAAAQRGEVLWILTDFAVGEGGGPYGPGFDLFGLPSARLLMLRVSHAIDVLWAMEEGLRCRALAGVIAELTGEGSIADLTATRRLALAARDGVGTQASGFGLLLRHKDTTTPSAAATRWQVAAAPSQPDAYGGLGRTRFALALRRNRRGPCSRWIIEWDHHECAFQPEISSAVAAPALDGSDRAPVARAG